MITSSRGGIKKEPRDINKKNPGKTYLPRFLDETDVESLKASVDRELADISMYMEKERQITSKIIPGSTFVGTWDACTDKYPEAEVNSTWDVIVTCGNSHVFDGKTWLTGQQLIYLSASDVYVQRTNPGTDGMKHELELLKVEVGESKAKIETNRVAIAETNFALSSLSVEVKAQIASNTALIRKTDEAVVDLTKVVATNKTELQAKLDKTNSNLTVTNQTIATLTSTVASNKTELQSKIDSTNSQLNITNKTVADNKKAAADATTALRSEVNGQVASINQTMSTVSGKVNTIDGEVNVLQSKWTVQADVNGKISGIEMVNDGRKSNFTIQTDRFVITDGSTTKVPFKIESGKTRIDDLIARNVKVIGGDLNINNNAIIYTDGRAVFKNADVSGAVRATSGEFRNVIIYETCDFRGTIKAQKIEGDIIKNYVCGRNAAAVTIPAQPFARIITSPSIILGSVGNTSSSIQMRINGTAVVDMYVRSYVAAPVFKQRSLYYALPANTSVTVQYTHSGKTDEDYNWYPDRVVVSVFKQ